MSGFSEGSIQVDANVKLERNGETEVAVETEMVADVRDVLLEMISGQPTPGFSFVPDYLIVNDPEPITGVMNTPAPMTPAGKLNSIVRSK